MTMPRPFRLQVLDALAAVVRTVAPANGYFHDLSEPEAVVIGRLFIGNDEVVPMVAINEPPLAIEQIKSARDNHESAGDWDLLIQGWAEEGEIHQTENAYVLAAEVRQALAKEKTKNAKRHGYSADILGFRDKIADMSIGAPVVRPPDEASAKPCFYIILTLKISEDMTKPFG